MRNLSVWRRPYRGKRTLRPSAALCVLCVKECCSAVRVTSSSASLRLRLRCRSPESRRGHKLRLEPLPVAADNISLHREILRKPKAVDNRGSVLVPLLDSLPEFPLVLAGERRAILLALMLEDRENLASKLVL